MQSSEFFEFFCFREFDCFEFKIEFKALLYWVEDHFMYGTKH